jgi:predicted transcriptional regulator
MWQVKNTMRKDVITINSNATVKELAKRMATDERYEDQAIILEQCKPIGIVTERDIIKVVAQKKDYAQTNVSEIMTSSLQLIDPDEDLSTANNLMKKHNVQTLVVFKDNTLYGIITSRCIYHRFQVYTNKTFQNILRSMPQ